MTFDVLDRTMTGEYAKTFAYADPETKRKQITVKGRKLIVQVPYAQMGLKRKQDVRV